MLDEIMLDITLRGNVSTYDYDSEMSNMCFYSKIIARELKCNIRAHMEMR